MWIRSHTSALAVVIRVVTLPHNTPAHYCSTFWNCDQRREHGPDWHGKEGISLPEQQTPS